MATRQIREGFKQFLQDGGKFAEQLGDGWANGMKEIGCAYCNLWSKSPHVIKQNPVGGFLEGSLNNACQNCDGFTPPQANYDEEKLDELEFSGGQCSDKYRVKWGGRYNNYFNNTNNIGKTGRGIIGPISSIKRFWEFDGSFLKFGVLVTHNDGEQTEVVQILGAEEPFYPWEIREEVDSWSFVIDDVSTENGDNPADDCGDPPSPPPPEGWEDPQPPTSDDTDINIDIDLPDNYPDNFPRPKIQVEFDSDNRKFKGDKFEFRLEGGDIILEWDDEDPPPFAETDGGDGIKQGELPIPKEPDFLPEGLDFPTIPKFLREQFDKIDNFIPTPLPGVSVGDILDILNNLLDDEEDSEPIDEVVIPYYDCDAEEFSSITWEVVRSSWSDADIETLTTNADNAKLWCDEPNLLIGYPDWWAVRAGANRPQIVQLFRRKDTRTYHSLVIPHYREEPEPETAAIGEYQSGNVMCREILTDNSALLVYARDEDEGERVLDEMANWVKSEMRTDPPERTFQRRQGRPVAESRRIPRVVEIWSEGRKSGGAPDKQWKCPPFNEPIP